MSTTIEKLSQAINLAAKKLYKHSSGDSIEYFEARIITAMINSVMAEIAQGLMDSGEHKIHTWEID